MTFQRFQLNTTLFKEYDERNEEALLPEYYYSHCTRNEEDALRERSLFRDAVLVKEQIVVLYRQHITSWHIFGKVSKAQVDFHVRRTENTNDEDEKQIREVIAVSGIKATKARRRIIKRTTRLSNQSRLESSAQQFCNSCSCFSF